MKNRYHNKKTDGTITVFLSLILLLILSLLFTIIEGARVSTAKVYAERALTTAMDSVLAEYYGPLWEEYHIFGYYSAEDNTIRSNKQMESLLDEYMSYTFNPNINLTVSYTEEGLEMYDITADEISTSNEIDLTDYEGKLLINEAVEYMKYREAGAGIEALLNKLSLLETPQKVSYIMEEKLKVEEELVEIDKGILELMELLDGICTSKKGIELTGEGALKSTDSFIKKICFEEILMETVGINNENVFMVQKDNYVDPNSYFRNINAGFTQLEQILSKITIMENTMIIEKSEQAEEETKLFNLLAIENKSVKDKQQIKTMKEEIETIELSIRDLGIQIRNQEALLQPLVSVIQDSKNEVDKLINESKSLIVKAISVLDGIIQKTELAAPMIDQYEMLLSSEKEFIDNEVYKGLDAGLSDLKKYIATEDMGYDFNKMKSILEKNLETLNGTEGYLVHAEEKLSVKYYQGAKILCELAQGRMSTYQIKGLTLDYSTLVLDKSGQKTPIDKISSLLQSGLTSLVLDQGNISKFQISTAQALPSEIAAMAAEDSDFLSALTSFFENAGIGDNTGMESIFSGFGDGTQIRASLGDTFNDIAEHILYQEYLKEHFEMYQTESISDQVQKPSVLKYEQEYLLVGKPSDQENVSSVVSRIIFLRTILDFASILGNKTIQSEAKLIATSLVGFTGLPILISITQVLILIMWAFAEGLLDTCALMMGKSVPILKKNVVMQFTDLFLINPEYLKQKSLQLTKTNEISLTYQDYLRVFLLMKEKKDIAYLSMDLMQENIKLRYEVDGFRIEDCIFGFDAEAQFIIKSKFTAFSYVKKYLKNSTEGFGYTVKASYSY